MSINGYWTNDFTTFKI